MRSKIIWVSVLGILLLAWLILFFSSKAILIHSEAPKDTADGLIKTITCTYFTGTGIFEKQYVYSGGGILVGIVGRPGCPRIENI